MPDAPTSANSSMLTLARTRLLFWIIDAAIILYATLDVIAQLLPPHYSPITQSESNLAVGPYGYLMTANFVNRGLFSLLFLLVFVRTIRSTGGDPRQYRGGIFLLGVWAFGAILLAMFPTDVPSAPMSWHGAVHLVVAILAFLGGSLGELSISPRLGKVEALGVARRFALPISIVALTFCLIVLGLPLARPHLVATIGGLIERIFLGLVILWMFAISTYLGTRLSTDAHA